MKKILLTVAAATISSPVLAGPYVNVETNASYSGSDYQSRATDLHVGYENSLGSFDWYVQGGKTINSVDGSDSNSNFSGKFGGSVAATKRLGIYGEVAFSNIFDEETSNTYNTKLGTKFSF
tara:strand:- start:558 stop:920 length:363 start_codon:yes stop_codon:yes gene_type:complete